MSIAWAAALSTHYIDYGYLAFVAGRAWSGRPVQSCLDLPPEYWTRIGVCMPDAPEGYTE